MPNGYVVPAVNRSSTAARLARCQKSGASACATRGGIRFDDPSRGGTGAIIIGDVGQGAWEEVDYEPAGRGGRNYGWRNREGAHVNVTSRAARVHCR